MLRSSQIVNFAKNFKQTGKPSDMKHYKKINTLVTYCNLYFRMRNRYGR